VKRALAVCAAAGAVLALATMAFADSGTPPSREIAIPGKVYEPAHASILAGTTVTWRNGDSSNHTVTADGDAFDSGYVPQGGTFSFTFDRQGHYAYHCAIHRFMKGVVDVFGLVLTGPDAPVAFERSFVLAGLAPAGTVSVTLRRVGHGEATRTVRARADGSFAVRVPAGAPGSYRATAGRATSPVVRVKVIPRVRVTRSGKAVVGATEPTRAGAPAELQAYERELFGWRPVAHSRLDGNSRVRFRLPGGRPARFRIVVRGGGGWADAASPALVLAR